MSDENFDDDGLFEVQPEISRLASELSSGKPGSLLKLYDAVIEACRKDDGEAFSASDIRILLEHMGRPDSREDIVDHLKILKPRIGQAVLVEMFGANKVTPKSIIQDYYVELCRSGLKKDESAKAIENFYKRIDEAMGGKRKLK